MLRLNATTVNIKINDGTNTNLEDFLSSIEERMKKLEDDFQDHILLVQKLETTEKK